MELSDQATAAAIALTINASGVITVTTTPLLTAEEIDEAVGKSIEYRPPGG